ncbi:MAG: CatB-related O-acetyltransferase [Paludibacteraceae bacterium]|jgi:acetyltransferase-like isoleucine patch superfamily enzyme|nr:CatB-related O-acetyltransferase [Paludibacteraceae bacterium]
MRNLLQKILVWIFPQLAMLRSKEYDFTKLSSWHNRVKLGKNVKINTVSIMSDVELGDYSYINDNSVVTNTKIGKFCSIGPNFFCGWGVHPTNGISTSPMFYSSNALNSISSDMKLDEHPMITIGNDVFIGANVTVLEGVNIGDGAVIGAGAVVSKDIPPYAVAVGSPIQIIRYRFSESQIEKFQRIEWWKFDKEKLKDIEQMFFDVDAFLEKYDLKD